MRYRKGKCDLIYVIGGLLFLSIWVMGVNGSIHEYKDEAFIPRFNSFFFHGGSEGLYASKVQDSPLPVSDDSNNNNNKPLNGKSFIRFESITFRRTKEAANKQNEMQQSTGIVEAIILEVKDRNEIGGSYLNSDAICCTPALAKDGSCKVGEVIIHHDAENPGWPKRIQTSFEGNNEEANMVLLLGVVYFLASEALELVEHLGNINDFSGKARIFLVLPVALLDSCFIVWIFSSLSKTLEKLQIRRSMAKLELYRKFTNSLAVSVLLSVAWIGYELYFNASDPLSELWRRAWIIPAFWTLLAYLLLLVICILWAPSNNPTRYAYSGETLDDEEEGLSLTGSGVIVGGDLVSKLERKERKASIAADHVFGLGEVLEEDKRE
ncbi:hypothetical protein HAX54_044489 [Datura stramonium]|uniref:GOST seven transmembrane domain-containing protein n=1 Tax=Datura stramonium TaxID=4076 RepID=A0ABS8WEQ0_DATST|nr:hypothetical protein [Datura stramonium]